LGGKEVAYLLAEGDLVEIDHPAAQVGRREEVVLLEHHALAHHRLHLPVAARARRRASPLVSLLSALALLGVAAALVAR
jgi:hypothetical protein